MVGEKTAVVRVGHPNRRNTGSRNGVVNGLDIRTEAIADVGASHIGVHTGVVVICGCGDRDIVIDTGHVSGVVTWLTMFGGVELRC